MDLLALADFNLVARHGGFGRASRAADRPKATLSRRVAELESSLNLRLFERGGRLLKLTQEGRALYERTEALLTELAETATSISSGGDTPRGHLRISAPLLFSQTAMGELAAKFALMYPEVSLEVSTDDRMVDMVEEGYDLVIRVNPDPHESLIGRIFLHDRLVVVASPGLEMPQGESFAPAVMRSKRPPSTAWDLITPTGPARIHANPVLSLSSLIMIRSAVRTGIGAAQLPLSLVMGDLQAATLVQWGEIQAPGIELWALYPSRRLLSARVSAFLEFLKTSFPTGAPEELAAYIKG